jgi:outer membrane immunogenic protein
MSRLKNTLALSIFCTLAAANLSSALAADLPPPPPPPVEMRSSTYDWSGAYIGGIVGAGSVDNTYVPIGAPDPDLSGSGFIGGGMIGYNMQMNNFVAGIEGDGMFSGIKPKNTSDGVDQHVTYLATIRARLGWAHDNTLFYGTAGVGFLGSKIHIMPADETVKKTHIGIVAGGGIEHGFTQNITARVEYLYGHFGKKDYVYVPGTIRTGIKSMHMARAGIAYKF